VADPAATVTLDRYGHLFPGNESQAAALLDAYLEQASTGGVPVGWVRMECD
jgi:hypothetical protein